MDLRSTNFEWSRKFYRRLRPEVYAIALLLLVTGYIGTTIAPHDLYIAIVALRFVDYGMSREKQIVHRLGRLDSCNESVRILAYLSFTTNKENSNKFHVAQC